MKRAFRRGLGLLPYGKWFDQAFIFIMFLYAHWRIPRKSSGLVNDYFYFLKSSPELLDIYRQITSDKALMKGFVRERCGDQSTLATFGTFDSVNAIDANSLKKPCVLKPAHGSGAVVFVYEGQTNLSQQDREKLSNALETSPYLTAREANYRFLRPRIICEPMLSGCEKTKDYKVFCFLGQPRLIQVDSDRHSSHKRNIYTTQWIPLEIDYNFPRGELEVEPSCLSDMLGNARLLSAEFDFVRVDFFIDGDELFVGELTHCPESAHGRFKDRDSEKYFSEILFQSDPVN